MKILGIGNERKILKTADWQVQWVELSQLENITGAFDVLYIDLIQNGLDQQYEQIVDILEEQQFQVHKIVAVLSAGVDHEIQPDWLGDDLQERVLQMQYAAKLVDETEIPYVIVRPTAISTENAVVKVVPEGQKIMQNKVSVTGLAEVVQQIIMTNQFLNQSIGVTNE